MNMKALFGCTMGLVLAACLCFAQDAVPTAWKSFISSAGFSVKYPDTWHRKGVSKDRLTILSSRGGADAIVIKRGQAMISVIEAAEGGTPSLSQVMGRYTQGVAILSKRDVGNGNLAGRGCHDLREVISRESAVPPEDVPGPVPYIINTELFCKADKHIYVIVLRNFEGDKRQGQYQTIALQVAKSLRVDE